MFDFEKERRKLSKEVVQKFSEDLLCSFNVAYHKLMEALCDAPKGAQKSFVVTAEVYGIVFPSVRLARLAGLNAETMRKRIVRGVTGRDLLASSRSTVIAAPEIDDPDYGAETARHLRQLARAHPDRAKYVAKHDCQPDDVNRSGGDSGAQAYWNRVRIEQQATCDASQPCYHERGGRKTNMMEAR